MGVGSFITAIKASAASGNRYVVHVDGKPIGTLPGKVIERLGLTLGMSYDGMIRDAVRKALEFDMALQSGIRLVYKRPLSEAEVREKLREEGMEEPVVLRVVDRLKELTLVNDAALAMQIIEHLNSKRPAGPALVRQKLQDRKIPESTIERMLGDMGSMRSPHSGMTPTLAQAYSLAREKINSMTAGLPIDTMRRRVAGLLARRGFEEDLIQEILADLLPDDSRDLDGYNSVQDP